MDGVITCYRYQENVLLATVLYRRNNTQKNCIKKSYS